MEATLRRELEEAFQGRAHLYRVFFDELAAEFGPERAEAVMVRAIERRGREIGEAHYRRFGGDPVAVGDAFVSVSPDGGRMYPNSVSRSADGMDIEVHRCPLKDAWTGADIGDDQVARLCRIAGAFDKGLFEGAGLKFSNSTWSSERGGGCCRIHLRRA